MSSPIQEEESTTLKSEEQVNNITKKSTPPVSLSNSNTITVKEDSKTQSPRVHALKTSQSTPNLQNNSSINKNIKKFFVKLSINFSILISKIKFLADEVLSSDEIETGIFYPTESSSILEFYQDEDLNTTAPMTHSQEYPDDDIRNIDINVKAEELRQESAINAKPFIGGDELWQIQNQQWLIPLEEYQKMNGRIKLERKIAEQELKHLVSTKDYSVVYNQLIIKNKNLKKPMNLSDLLKVINAGWTVNKTWERAAKGI